MIDIGNLLNTTHIICNEQVLLKTGVNACTHEGYEVLAPLVATIVLLLLKPGNKSKGREYDDKCNIYVVICNTDIPYRFSKS